MRKGRVCVTGGTGFLASWIIKKLLEYGYTVNTTVRLPSGSKKDLSFLTSLPHAQDRLHIFSADLNDPQSFKPAIEGCSGLFHVAHPMDMIETANAETMTEISIKGTLGILQACIDSQTVKRVVYTSSSGAALSLKDGNKGPPGVVDEGSWTDVDYLSKLKFFGVNYCVSKTMTERAAVEFAEKHGLDLVAVIPTWVLGPFICPNLPESLQYTITGHENQVGYAKVTSMVHVDDVSEAHVFLFEYPQAKGRYICSAVEARIEEVRELLSVHHPRFKLLNIEIRTDPTADCHGFSSRKLLETGFKFKHGLQEMFYESIECCKQRGFL